MFRTLKHVAVSFIILIAVWQTAVTVSQVNPALFPSPHNVVSAFLELCSTGLRGSTSNKNLFGHIGVSMVRFFLGYLTAAVSGVIFGLVLGIFPKIFAYINPLLQMIRPIASIAWLPFIVLWFGIGDLPAVIIIFIAGFFPVLLSTVAAVKHVDATYLKVAQNFGISRGKSLVKIIFPAVFPQIMNSLHLALGTSWIFLVSGEMVGAQSGLGFLVMDAKNCIRSDALLAVMITIGVIGFLLDTAMNSLEKWVRSRFGLGVTANAGKA